MADLPNKISLTIVTRERKIIDTQVDEVILPASDGEREIADLSSNDPEFALVEARLEESIAMINVHREH